MRTIDASGFPRPAKPADAGPAPMLQWIKITDLVVDPSYQRPITGQGRGNVKKIAAAFSWSKFAAVIVSPVEGGKFAIVDGQHRTTAAAIVGAESVPCLVIVADRQAQAAAFKAINGVTTRITRQAIHAAAVVAGDADALAIEDVCSRAEVQVLRYPVSEANQVSGQTMAVGCLRECLDRYGRDTLVTALQCITQTENNSPGLLVAHVIKALCDTIGDRPEWRDAGSDLLAAFDEIDIRGEFETVLTSARPKGVSIANALAARLTTALTAAFDARKAA